MKSLKYGYVIPATSIDPDNCRFYPSPFGLIPTNLIVNGSLGYGTLESQLITVTQPSTGYSIVYDIGFLIAWGVDG